MYRILSRIPVRFSIGFLIACSLLTLACLTDKSKSQVNTVESPEVNKTQQAVSPTQTKDLNWEKVVRDSFAAYPWRMKTNVFTKSTNQTTTGLIEAQSATKVHLVSNQEIEDNTVTIESILIDSDLYMKATGAPPEHLAQYGATNGKWMKVPKGHPIEGFAELCRLVADPPRLLEKLGFMELYKKMGPNQKPHVLTGTESVNGIQTNVYEYKVGSGTASVSYRVLVGTSDQRIYKMVSDSSLQTATTIVEYDSGINIVPPIP